MQRPIAPSTSFPERRRGGAAAQVDEAWRHLARLIGGDTYAADTRFHHTAERNAHREQILAKVRAWTSSQPSVKACCVALDAAEVPCAPGQHIDEVVADPQVAARNMTVEQDHPLLGKVRLPNLPFRFSSCDTSPRGVAPLLGQAPKLSCGGAASGPIRVH